MSEPEKIAQSSEQVLNSKELYEQRKREKNDMKKTERRKEKLQEAPKKAGRYILYGIIGIVGISAVVGGILFVGQLSSTGSGLPPTTQINHSENSPSAHITDKPIPDRIQRHMLEHADGKDSPGIIIQYNCEDFECEPNFVQQLITLVEQYPENVYLAPNKYDGKIILTKLGRREILESFNEQTIRSFIER